MTLTRRSLACFLAMTPLVMAATADAAHAGTPTCGAAVTADVVLTEDLVCAEGDGLIVGADNITIDLGGHWIRLDPYGWDTAGVRVSGYSGVTVRNGSVDNRGGSALTAEGAHSLTVQGFRDDRTWGGVRIHDTDHASITESWLGGWAYPLDLQNSTGSRITNNYLGGSDGIVRLTDVNGTVLADNFIGASNSDNFIVAGDNNQILRNTSVAFSQHGHIAGTNNLFQDNRMFRGMSGVSFSGTANRVVGNVLEDVESSGYRVIGTRNVVTGNTATGLRFSPYAFYVEDSQATLAGNSAVGNDGLGFYATTKVGGGGNRAIGNSDPRQCVNVSCVPEKR